MARRGRPRRPGYRVVQGAVASRQKGVHCSRDSIPMLRIAAGTLVCVIAGCAAANTTGGGAAAGRVETEIPPLPRAGDLQAAPLGSWAEYAESFTGFTNTNRVAAVRKTPEALTIESTRTGGLFASDKLTWANTFALGDRKSTRLN